MGDHFNTVDPNHPNDTVPLHRVGPLSGFDIGKFDITNEQYCDYLNSALSQGLDPGYQRDCLRRRNGADALTARRGRG